MKSSPEGSIRWNLPNTVIQVLAAIFLFALTATLASAQSVPAITGNARVDKLLSQMTLEEKMGLIRGAYEDPATNQGQADTSPVCSPLGIPPLRMSDGPPGVLTRQPSQAETATMGLAATFSAKDAEENGVVIGREAKSLGIDVVLEPFINIDRDITFDRGYNTYGEDPVLTGIIGAGLIKGIQSQDVMAQAKHFVAYDTEGADVVVNQQALHEIYVAPFVDAVNADIASIMCLQQGEWHLRLRKSRRAQPAAAQRTRLQGFRHLRLGSHPRRFVHQQRPRHGDARSRSQRQPPRFPTVFFLRYQEAGTAIRQETQ